MMTMEMEMVDEAEDVGGMTDAEIDAKHISLRGSLKYKYPPRESSCRHECGASDYFKVVSKPPEHHRCFLAIGHQGDCEFSSECAVS